MRSGTKKIMVVAIVGIVVATVLIVVLERHGPPAGTFDVKTYEATWQIRVDGLLKGRQASPSSCWTLSAGEGFLPGFGPVSSYCWTSVPGHRLNFRFIESTDSGQQELLYMPESRDWKLQYGFCVVNLSGPWWQLQGPSRHCPDGFVMVASK